MSFNNPFDLLAEYNRCMNERLYHAAGKLDRDTLHADRGAFFGSVFATLDHLLVADTIWMKRFIEVLPVVPETAIVRALPHPYTLSGPLHAEFEPLHAARRRMDSAIVACFAVASDESFMRPLDYTNRTGQRSIKPFGPLAQHFFNHQTHHRGQITTLLSQVGIDVGVTDLASLVPDLPVS